MSIEEDTKPTVRDKLSKLPIDEKISPVLLERLDEINKCTSDTPLAIIFLCGSLLEGLLLGISLREEEKFKNTKAAKESGREDIKEWTLSVLIDAAIEVKALTGGVTKFSHALREFRNYIHPYRQTREDTQPSRDLAMMCKSAVNLVIKDLYKYSKPALVDDKSIEWDKHENAVDIAKASLIGGWNENSEMEDIKIVSKLVSEEYSTWIEKIKNIHFKLKSNSPLSYNDREWKILREKSLLESLGGRIYDDDIDRFRECIVSVLSEKNPEFDMPVEQGPLANVYGKTPKYSENLRNQLCLGLAFMSCYPDLFNNCSSAKIKYIAYMSVSSVLKNADSKIWANLNELLPCLAEASPESFLSAVDASIQADPNPFKELFEQEKRGTMIGHNYMTGLVSALGILAWDKNHLSQCCVFLAKLASIDPGGNWIERPINLLYSILRLRNPQTSGSIGKRQGAMKAVIKTCPEVAWKLIIGLLSGEIDRLYFIQPIFRKYISESINTKSGEEYDEQVAFYSDMAMEMAGKDGDKLQTYVAIMELLPQPSREKLVDGLSEMKDIKEELKCKLWPTLARLISRHRNCSEERWAMTETEVGKIEEISERFKPLSPSDRYEYLFTDNDHFMYEDFDNWREGLDKFERQKKEYLLEIIEFGGLEAVLEFSQNVNSPFKLGITLGDISDGKTDCFFLPKLLNSEKEHEKRLIASYISRAYYKRESEWVDSLDYQEWNSIQKSEFLVALPFIRETWERVAKWLGNDEGKYWKRVSPMFLKEDLDMAIDKLMEYERPRAALYCLSSKFNSNKTEIDAKKTIRILNLATQSNEEHFPLEGSRYWITEIIKYLQENPAVDKEDIIGIEWKYFQFLDEKFCTSPMFLEKELSKNPMVFSNIVEIVYSRDKLDNTVSTDQKEKIRYQAFQLLNRWKVVPGALPDGSFDPQIFRDWLEKTKKFNQGTDRHNKAMEHIGKILFHSPKDPSGLWIHKDIAEALDEENMNAMRLGFCYAETGEMGGWIDPTGEPEKREAKQWEDKADEVDCEGFHRLAISIRKGIVETYERIAERHIQERKKE